MRLTWDKAGRGEAQGADGRRHRPGLVAAVRVDLVHKQNRCDMDLATTEAQDV